MNDDRTMLYVRINNKMKNELKLISVYEETTITDIVSGFIQYGLKRYDEDQTLIK